jgi:hypothetical protein
MFQHLPDDTKAGHADAEAAILQSGQSGMKETGEDKIKEAANRDLTAG